MLDSGNELKTLAGEHKVKAFDNFTIGGGTSNIGKVRSLYK